MRISIAEVIRKIAYSEKDDMILTKMVEGNLDPNNSFEKLIKTRKEGIPYFRKLSDEEKKKLEGDFGKIEPPLKEMETSGKLNRVKMDRIVAFYKKEIVPALKKEHGPSGAPQ